MYGSASAAARHLAVLDAAELVVLLPEIGLEDLGRGEKPEDRGVALGQAGTAGGGKRRGPRAERSKTRPDSNREPGRQERSTTEPPGRRLLDVCDRAAGICARRALR